jgi:predicted RNase H-related nuclease YkuK (DUF458 family)
MYKERFKKFGGEYIPDIIEYLKDKISRNPNITISVGCDSIQHRRKTVYANTIMLYDTDLRNGAHVVFFRETLSKVRDNNQRLFKEYEYAHSIAEYLNNELEEFYERKDLSIFQRKAYKYHLLYCEGKLNGLNIQDVDRYINNITLTDYEKVRKYKLVDVHLDFNPFESTRNGRQTTNNKSNSAYNAYVPSLRGMDYRVYAKNLSFAATSAADLLLK